MKRQIKTLINCMNVNGDKSGTKYTLNLSHRFYDIIVCFLIFYFFTLIHLIKMIFAVLVVSNYKCTLSSSLLLCLPSQKQKKEKKHT